MSVVMQDLPWPARSYLLALLSKLMEYSRLAERFAISDFAYAHRGLWETGGPPENSLDAFLAAATHGLGIEFDIRPSADGVPIIFHDPTLDRMTEASGKVEERTSDALVGTPLIGGGEIVTLATFLEAWPATTPLLCELKVDGATDPVALSNAVSSQLKAHGGPAAMMSFSTKAVAAVPTGIMKGQLILPSKHTGETDLASTPTTQVDYLACHISDAANTSLQSARTTRPLVTWTVKDEATCDVLNSLTDSQIFEGFDPVLAKRHILNR